MKLTYRQQAALLGAIVGGVIGAVVALLYLDRADEAPDAMPSIGWQELSQIAVALGALVRQVNALAHRPDS